jgi:hypothetical protein
VPVASDARGLATEGMIIIITRTAYGNTGQLGGVGVDGVMDGQGGTGGGHPMHPPDQPMRPLSVRSWASIALVCERISLQV